ncbi:hypothetical protein GCM10010399_80190 [Dactylosporangium fulvum]|uniref:DUF2637 domain-containing protein n=1 Tax=Dactylosporangium fulvum TaxID=53359 RepID=A0ABY5VWR0_9ACTN|nr:DUF2637 domain-containing protein [Dactylosporangium fulvum]UWP81271.1 DUF2637 domain-containing protein [Dactylosporangium fulvum]
MSRVDSAIRAAAGVTVVALAGIAGAISYSHMTELADAHGEVGWRAHMFPLSVDGIEIVASLVLLADKRAARSSGWLPWAALIAGTGASFAANVAVGGADWIGRAVSGWPAFALLIAVKLLFGLLDHPAGQPAPPQPLRQVPAQIGPPRPVPEEPEPVPDGSDAFREGRRGNCARDADGNDVKEDGPLVERPDFSEFADWHRTLDQTLPPDVVALLPAARQARAELAAAGRAASREALARQLRANGHAASNARISAVQKALLIESSAVEPDEEIQYQDGSRRN